MEENKLNNALQDENSSTDINMPNILNLTETVEKEAKHIPEESYHNLVFATIESVGVELYEIKLIDDNGNPSTSEYAGLTVPRLTIKTKRTIMPFSIDKNHRAGTFSWGVHYTKNNKENIALPQKDVIKKVQDEFKQILHICGVIKRHFENYPELDMKLINSYNPFAPAAERVAKLTEIYNYFASHLSTINPLTSVPYTKDLTLIWVLIPGGNKRTQWVLPQYVGEGFVEVFKNKETHPIISVPANVVMKLGELTPKATSSATPKSEAANFDAFANLNN